MMGDIWNDIWGKEPEDYSGMGIIRNVIKNVNDIQSVIHLAMLLDSFRRAFNKSFTIFASGDF